MINQLGLGTDLDCLTDVTPKFSLTSGIDNPVKALCRRLQTPHGGLFYAPDYGFDLGQFVNADIDSALLQEIRSGVTSECLKDDRVTGCSVQVSYDPGAETIKVAVSVSSLTGTGKFIASIGKVSVAFLTSV